MCALLEDCTSFRYSKPRLNLDIPWNQFRTWLGQQIRDIRLLVLSRAHDEVNGEEDGLIQMSGKQWE